MAMEGLPSKRLNLIVIYDQKFGIAKDEKFPFPKLKTDFDFMCHATQLVENPSKRNALIFGRKTWYSDIEIIQSQWKSEYKIVLSRSTKVVEGSDHTSTSLHEAINHIQSPLICNEIENIWVMGGYIPYKQALESGMIVRIYATEIFHDFGCDVFFPLQNFSELNETEDKLIPTKENVMENGIEYKFHVYEKK